MENVESHNLPSQIDTEKKHESDLSVVEMREKKDISEMRSKVQELREFFDRWIPKIDKWSSATPDTLQGCSDEIKEFLRVAKSSTLLNAGPYQQLVDSQQLSGHTLHDIGNAANSVILGVTLVKRSFEKMGKNPDNFYKNLGLFKHTLFKYLNIFEDSVLREEYGTLVPEVEPKRELDLQLLQKSMVPELDTKWQNPLSSGEAVTTVPPVVVNAISNMLRNAAKQQVGAKHVKFDIVREENEIVCRVTDDGSGIAQDQLTPGSEQFIFKHGVSGTDSTGLGLADLPQRLESIGAHLVVRTHPAKLTDATYIGYASDKQSGRFIEGVGIPEGLDFTPSTIMEIRLPIHTK